MTDPSTELNSRHKPTDATDAAPINPHPFDFYATAHLLLSEDAIRFTLRSYVIVRKLRISND